jgi:hypothetical protein
MSGTLRTWKKFRDTVIPVTLSVPADPVSVAVAPLYIAIPADDRVRAAQSVKSGYETPNLGIDLSGLVAHSPQRVASVLNKGRRPVRPANIPRFLARPSLRAADR